MNIPNFLDCVVVDKDGRLTDTWRQIFTQLFAQLQRDLSEEGIKIPRQSSTNITDLNTPKSIGATLYNNNTNRLMGNLDGVFKNIAQDGTDVSFSNLQVTSLDANRAVITDVDDNITSSITTDTELSYLSGTTGSVQNQLNGKEPTIVVGTSMQYWRGDKNWITLDTSVVPENTNLYYTDTRARNAISSTATGLTYTSSTGVLSLTINYAIPTTTAISNWNSAYYDTSHGTPLNIAGTLAKRDANKSISVDLSDEHSSARLSVAVNDRILVDSAGIKILNWEDSQITDGYANLSIDWYMRNLCDASGTMVLDWSHGVLLDPSSIFSIDWISRYLIDEVGRTALSWDSRFINVYDGGGAQTVSIERDSGIISCLGLVFNGEEALTKYDLDTVSLTFSGIWASSTNISIKTEIIGKTVTLKIPGYTATANIASFISTTALSSDIRPTSTLYLFVPQTVNNGADSVSPSLIVINTTGVINIYNRTSNFSGAGISGFKTFSITYSCA